MLRKLFFYKLLENNARLILFYDKYNEKEVERESLHENIFLCFHNE